METGIKLVVLLYLIITAVAHGGTCTSITRSNYSANSVLTSTALNADFNNLVTGHNAFDGGCTSSYSIEKDALGTGAGDFAGLLNGLMDGCKVTASDTNTLSVNKCILAVNGNFVKTSGATTVTWGCTSCSSESASTVYYLFAKTGSTGATLNLLISTSAPGADGYDGSGNRVLAKFYNDFSSNIHPVIQMWMGAGFDSDYNQYSARIYNNGTASIVSQGGDHNAIASVNRSAAGQVDITYTTNEFSVIPAVVVASEANTYSPFVSLQTTTGCQIIITDNVTGGNSDQSFAITINRQGNDKKTR